MFLIKFSDLTFLEITSLISHKKNSVFYRSQPSRIDVSHIPANKKIRFYDGPQVESLSKEDFTSHEAWIKCLKLYTSQNRKLASMHKKNIRQQKKIGNIKELVAKLKEENATAAAEYIQVTA